MRKKVLNPRVPAAEAELAAPNPGSLINSLRAFGYGFETAIADLIDNSITAGASRIDIRFDFNDGKPRLSLTDNGKGMTEQELIAALRLGSTSPNEKRHKDDLGRFGLGLKTAAFSQGKRLIVATKTRGTVLTSRCWDLDFVETCQEWRLLYGDQYLSSEDSDHISSLRQGTTVVLENLDRMFSGGSSDSIRKSQFFSRAEQLSGHLGTVFHRFLVPPKKVEIWINPDIPGASPVPAWDPFLIGHDKTQILPDEYLQLDGASVHVQPFVLPHQSAFKTSEEHRRAGGIKGWNAQQGFYVYRNKRLLVSGSWLNLGIRQEEHYKLARIALDIPNTQDEIWSIDVRKSQAVPPAATKSDLKRIATRVRKQAKEVYGHRGRIINTPLRGKLVQLWNARKKDEKISYHVNRDYPLVENLRQKLDGIGKETLSKLLTLIEETIPINKIYFNAVETPECHKEAFEGERDLELIETARILLRFYEEAHGYDFVEALELLMIVEPFNRYPYLRESLKKVQSE